MIHPRQTITVERRAKVQADMHGNGSMLAELSPRRPGHEYVTLVIGDCRKGEVVTLEDVLRALNATLQAAQVQLDARSPN